MPFFPPGNSCYIDKFKETNLSTASETNEGKKTPVKRLRDSVYRPGKKRNASLLVFVVSDFVVENPQSLVMNFSEAAVELWRVKCRWHDAFPARKRLCSKRGPRDVHLNQSRHVIFVLVCVSFSLFLEKRT